jgi:hypothetical protein
VLSVSHTVERRLNAGVERVFDEVVAEDVLPRVLHRWGPVPAVTATRDLTGPWDTPGSQRTVVLGDGSTACERVLHWERPAAFAYRVDAFTSPLGRLADHAVGWWEFWEPAGGGSAFRWTYTFELRGRAAALVMWPLVRVAWARYMEQCADLCVGLAVGPGSGSRPGPGEEP